MPRFPPGARPVRFRLFAGWAAAVMSGRFLCCFRLVVKITLRCPYFPSSPRGQFCCLLSACPAPRGAPLLIHTPRHFPLPPLSLTPAPSGPKNRPTPSPLPGCKVKAQRAFRPVSLLCTAMCTWATSLGLLIHNLSFSFYLPWLCCRCRGPCLRRRVFPWPVERCERRKGRRRRLRWRQRWRRRRRLSCAMFLLRGGKGRSNCG